MQNFFSTKARREKNWQYNLTAVFDTRVSICFSRPEKCLKVFFPGNLLYCRENLTTK